MDLEAKDHLQPPAQSKDKYFILKSVGKSVVRNSFSDRTYSVQPAVGNRLNRAFVKSRQQSGNVYVIVSTKRSKSFQGLGRMEGIAQGEANSTRLRFPIEWVSGFVHVPFSEAEPIKQRIKSQFSVIASQDGQEIGGRAGKQLSAMILTAPPEEGQEKDARPTTQPEKEEQPPTSPTQEGKKYLELLQEEGSFELPEIFRLERFLEYPPTVPPPQLTSKEGGETVTFRDWSEFEVYFQNLLKTLV